MAGRTLALAPAALGLVFANALSIAVVIGCCISASRAVDLRDRALAALADARATAARRQPAIEPALAAIRSSARDPRVEAMDGMLLVAGVGVAGSVLCTWRLITGRRLQR